MITLYAYKILLYTTKYLTLKNTKNELIFMKNTMLILLLLVMVSSCKEEQKEIHNTT